MTSNIQGDDREYAVQDGQDNLVAKGTMAKHGSFCHHQSTPCKVSQEIVQQQNKPSKDMEGCVGLNNKNGALSNAQQRSAR